LLKKSIQSSSGCSRRTERRKVSLRPQCRFRISRTA
jgi:hypothetical protein